MRPQHFLIGLLSVLLWIVAPPAHALSPLCTQLLEPQPQPIGSHYVAKVLKRADLGIATAATAPAGSGDDTLSSLIGEAQSAFAAQSAAEVSLVFQSRDLLQTSICLHIDQLMLQCEMDKVRDAMEEAINKQSPLGIAALRSLLAFLRTRSVQLQTGAYDPSYRDTGWGRSELFDPPGTVFCCNPDKHEVDAPPVCEQLAEDACEESGGRSYRTQELCTDDECGRATATYDLGEEMCPYTSDYTLEFASGYGCDASVTDAFRTVPGVGRELEKWQKLRDAVAAAREDERDLLSLQDGLLQLLSGDPAPAQPVDPPERTHLRAFSCQWTGGYCSAARDVRCTIDDDCEDGPCTVPTTVCEHNRHLRCIDDAQCQRDGESFGPCIADDGGPIGLLGTRGPFSLDADHLSILERFLSKRIAQGGSRAFADEFKQAAEFKRQVDDERNDRTMDNIFTQLGRSSWRGLFQSWSKLQGESDARAFPLIADAELQIGARMQSLRTAVAELATVAYDRTTGMRSFIIRFASFLRRSCIQSPCNASLQQVMKIADTDACFPYTRSAFLDRPEESDADECRKQADLP